MWWRKRFRGTLKKHLDAQWLRGQGNPKERPASSKRYRNRGPREFHDDSPAGTLAEVWPEDSA